MSLLLAQIMGQVPRQRTARGRIVLKLTGKDNRLLGANKTSTLIMIERELIYKAIAARGEATRDQIAEDTGLDPEVVTSRLSWLGTHGIVRCWRSKNTAVWKVEKSE